MSTNEKINFITNPKSDEEFGFVKKYWCLDELKNIGLPPDKCQTLIKENLIYI